MLYKLYGDSIHKPVSDKSLKRFAAGCSTLVGIELSEAIFGPNEDIAKYASIIGGVLIGNAIVHYGKYRKKLKLYKNSNLALDDFIKQVKERVGEDINISKDNVINMSGLMYYADNKSANNIKFIDDSQITEKFNFENDDYSCVYYRDKDTSYDITDLVIKLQIERNVLK